MNDKKLGLDDQFSQSNSSTFGFHASSIGSSSHPFNQGSNIQRNINLLDTMRKVAMVSLILLGIITAVGFSPGAGLIAVGVVVFVSISAFYYYKQYYNYQEICSTAGIIFSNPSDIKKFEVAGIQGKCEALPTEHSADTEIWRKDLIEAAEHNIVVSGNYCGGKSFTDFLSLIEKRIVEKPNLKVVILSSPNFIKNGNLKKIQVMQKKYPTNFSLVESPDIWHVSTGLKKSTNHTKCMVIDYGKYFILGGSGIKDNFAQTGLDDLSKEEFLTKRKLNTLPSLKQEDIDDDGFIGKFIPGNFRDMDFVFRCSGGKSPCGKQVYKQMLLLCYRWEQYNLMLKDKFNTDQLRVDDLGVFTNEPTKINSNDSVTMHLLKTPIPQWHKITTRVKNFDQSTKKSSNVAFRIFASGPEHNSSMYAAQLEEAIKKASKQIVINHMYFQPTTSIMNELIEAAKRGVKIKIITSCIYSECPNSHYVFGSRNKYNYAYLLNSLSENERENVEVYEFQQKKKGNHKKVIIVDDMVIAGSSNLGYKSLVSTSDHELNFFAQSQEFVDRTLEICEIDIQHSKKIKDKVKLSTSEYIKAAMHRLMAPLIG